MLQPHCSFLKPLAHELKLEFGLSCVTTFSLFRKVGSEFFHYTGSYSSSLLYMSFFCEKVEPQNKNSNVSSGSMASQNLITKDCNYLGQVYFQLGLEKLTPPDDPVFIS